MRNELRERLATEITRKQFLQYSAGILLMVFGLGNLLSLLTNGKIIERQIFMPLPSDSSSTFGSRKFGV